jgi:SAM-dependent methyltransferase
VFSETAAYYDVLYSVVKDFDAESARIAGLLRELHPGARTVLDAGCGTGRHARALSAAHGYRVDGFDLDPGMVRIAATRNPEGRFGTADLVEFDLGRRYDAIVCLFSSIGYVRTVENLGRSLRCFARHPEPGGVALIEPWFPPGVMQHGYVTSLSADDGGTKISRMSRTVIDGRISRLDFEYLIGRPEGIERASEIHELGLFTREEYADAFRAAGFDARYDESGLSGRGLWLARLAA